MKISLIQADLKWEEKESNFRNLGAMMAPLRGATDLVVLPETFSTGFSLNVGSLAEPFKGRTFNWMAEESVKGGFGVCGSFIIKENGSFYNRFLFISPEADYHFYDKRHLFSIGDEDKSFSRGSERITFNFMGFRIAPFICYDLRFPVWSRNRNDYDLAIYVANWPETRISVWDTLLKARAIENQCYVAGANRTGVNGEGKNHTGLSQVVNGRGEVIVSAGSCPQVITAEISLDELRDFRNKFNVSADADQFEIIT